MTNKLAHHMQGCTPTAANVVRSQRNARLIKTMDLQPHAVNALTDWKRNNPGGILSYRRWFGAETEGHSANLERWKDFCDQLAVYVKDNTPYGLVNAVYLPYNEIAPYAGHALNIYSEYMPRMADYLRQQFVHYGDMKIIGGNFSVTTPHPINTWDTIAPALPHLDYLCLHRYSKPTLRDGHEWLYDFEKIYPYLYDRGHKPPPLILGEFGVDGALWTDESMPRNERFKGWRAFMSASDYAKDLREANIRLGRYDYVFAACVFNLDQYPPVDWSTYLYADEPEIVAVFSEHTSLGSNAQIEDSNVSSGGNIYDGSGFYLEWITTPGNEHTSKPAKEIVSEFIEHAERVTGNPAGVMALRNMGMPLWMIDAFQNAHRQPTEQPQKAQEAVKVSKPIKAPKSADRGYTGVLAGLLGVDANAVQAVIDIESGGKAFADNGMPITRFELHIFLKRLTDSERNQANQNFRLRAGRSAWHNDSHLMNIGNGEWRKIHTGNQADEWHAINMAAMINREKAFESCSYGAFQIMGFHYNKLFYDSAESMYQGFSVSEVIQAWGFVCFIMSNQAMLKALRRGDYEGFARYYNGSGQAARYGRLIRNRINQLK